MLRVRRRLVKSNRVTGLSQESSNSSYGFARRGESASYPVLARLADVSAPSSTDARSSRAAAAGFVDYRFDTPAGSSDEFARPEPQPHVFKRSAPSEHRTRPFGGPSRALPGSNPFAIPSITLLERLAPLVHFLVLFILFTAAGTFLMSGRRGQSTNQHTPAPGRAVATPPENHPRLEPAAEPVRPTMTMPTAFGPLGATTPPAQNNVSPTELASDLGSLPTATPSAPALASAHGAPLPKLETTEPPEAPADTATTTVKPNRNLPQAERLPPINHPPIARLPGFIFEAPRQAYHDTNQPGLH